MYLCVRVCVCACVRMHAILITIYATISLDLHFEDTAFFTMSGHTPVLPMPSFPLTRSNLLSLLFKCINWKRCD